MILVCALVCLRYINHKILEESGCHFGRLVNVRRFFFEFLCLFRRLCLLYL